MATPAFQRARKRIPSRTNVSCTKGVPMNCENTCCGDAGLLRSTITSFAGELPGSMRGSRRAYVHTPISAVCTPASVSAFAKRSEELRLAGFVRL
jgi:hypothetical protein